jgi:hypothetical protein
MDSPQESQVKRMERINRFLIIAVILLVISAIVLAYIDFAP